MKKVFKTAIERGGYDLTGLLKNIDKYHIEGKLTDADRDELYALAREGAKPENSVDVMAVILDLRDRVVALEKAGNNPNASEEKLTKYVAGMIAKRGERYLFKGVVYTCIAPEGVACVWTPEGHPAYWQADTEEG